MTDWAFWFDCWELTEFDRRSHSLPREMQDSQRLSKIYICMSRPCAEFKA